MIENHMTAVSLNDITDAALKELIQRVEDINHSYTAVAQKMGQLYMCADEQHIGSLTQNLDKPMRNASDNQLSFAEMLEELQMCANQRK